MYVLVKVSYDYHRFQENVQVFTCPAAAARYQPGFEMYNPESEREDFFNGAQLSHYWLQGFCPKEIESYDWWFSLLYSDKVRILELYDDKALPPTKTGFEVNELIKLWDFHNNNYNKD